MKKNNSQKTILIFYVVLIIITLIPFFSIFLLPQSGTLKKVSAIIRYNNSYIIPIISTILFSVLTIKNNRISTILIALVIFTAFSYSLKGLWETMYTEQNVIAGILPRRDAFSFFGSAMSLLEKGQMVGYSTRRPLFGSFLASLLWIFDHNLTVVLAAIGYFSALATFFSIIEIKNSFNQIAATIFFIPQFLFYRQNIGNFMSEPLGFMLGILAFVFFLRYFRLERSGVQAFKYYITAVFFSTLSQLTRPGALATLPFLVLLPFFLNTNKKSNKLRSICLIMLSIGAAFLVDKGIYWLLTPANSIYNSNAYNGLYGVVSGGKFWWQLGRDYPEILSLDPGIRGRKTIEIIVGEFLKNPQNFFLGMKHQFSVILSLNPINTYNVFSFMLSNNYLVDFILIVFYNFLSLIGILFIFKKRAEPINKFAFILLFGFLLSLTFAPAYHEQFMRFYSGSIPLFGLVPAIGIFEIFNLTIAKLTIGKKFLTHNGEISLSILQNIFSILLLSILLITPFLINTFDSKSVIKQEECPNNLEEVFVNYYPNSEININEMDTTRLPYISYSKFRQGVHNIPNKVDISGFESIPANTILFPTVDLLSNKLLYVIFHSASASVKKASFHYCGFIDEIGGAGIFYPEILLD